MALWVGHKLLKNNAGWERSNFLVAVLKLSAAIEAPLVTLVVPSLQPFSLYAGLTVVVKSRSNMRYMSSANIKS